MIGKIAWGIALAGLAAAGSFAQLDRQSRSNPALAALVPQPMRGFAAERLAEQAIAAKDVAGAAQAARTLILARPLPAEHLSLLSLSAALAKDEPRALAALEQATMRGWRDPMAQVVAGQAALMQGNHQAAAQRITALLSTGNQPDQAFAMLARLLADPAGRTAFAKQIAARGRWQGDMLAPASAVVAPDDLARTIAEAHAEGGRLPCDRLASLAQKYVSEGQAASAQRFWPGDCPAS